MPAPRAVEIGGLMLTDTTVEHSLLSQYLLHVPGCLNQIERPFCFDKIVIKVGPTLGARLISVTSCVSGVAQRITSPIVNLATSKRTTTP